MKQFIDNDIDCLPSDLCPLTTTNPSIQFQITSEIENISLASLCTRAVSSYWTDNPETLMACELVVSEAVTNCIEHAYANQPGQPVSLTLSKIDGKIEIVIRDQGQPVPDSLIESAATSFDDPDDDPMLIAESGRGLMLIKTLMQQVSFKREDNWNVLTVVREL